MASLKSLRRTTPIRMLLVGYPGAGKTGALAALADAGFKLRIIDFDGNNEPLFEYVTSPDADVDILTFEDRLENSPDGRYMQPVGIPDAFNKALKAMKAWKYKDEDDNEIDLGSSKSWGPDTVLVVDGITGMGKAAFRRAQKMMNKTPLNTTDAVWGTAMSDQESFIELLTSASNRFHVIVLSHLKLVGPRDIRSTDDELTKDLKKSAAEIIPTRLYPSALGNKLPPFIAGHFPTVVLAEQRFRNGKSSRILRTVAMEELDLKVPGNVPAELPLESGLHTIFKHLGWDKPAKD